MEWSKLKNIILLLLVSVNAFLLILVGVQESRAARYEEDTRQAAVRVLEQSGILDVHRKSLKFARLLTRYHYFSNN